MTCGVPSCEERAVLQGVCSAHWLEADEAVHGAARCEAAILEVANERAEVARGAEHEWFIRTLGRWVSVTASRYEKYLASREWAVRRALSLWLASDTCEVCSSKDRLEVHHKTYARLTHELDDDLIVLCRTCHSLVHEKPMLRRWSRRTSWGTSW